MLLTLLMCLPVVDMSDNNLVSAEHNVFNRTQTHIYRFAGSHLHFVYVCVNAFKSVYYK